MKRFFALLLFAAAANAATVQSPSQFLGFEVGADRKLADYRQIVSYFRALAAASPRVHVESLGKTTLGEDFIMAVITSEGNMRNLEKIRETAAERRFSGAAQPNERDAPPAIGGRPEST